MPFLLMTHFPLYSGKNVFETEEEIIKRLNLIYDLTEGYYERRGRLDIWEEYLDQLEPTAVVVVKFLDLYYKDKSFIGLECPLREPVIPGLGKDKALQNFEDR